MLMPQIPMPQTAMPHTAMPHTARTRLAIAMLIALTAFSTVACSTTATDPASTDATASDTQSPAANRDTVHTRNADEDTANKGPANETHGDERPGDEGRNEQDASDPADSDTQPAAKTRDVSMRPGDSVTLANNGSMRYVRMVNDSRCKPDVQCIWAGNAELSFQWKKPGGGQETFSLNTSSRGGATEHRLGKQHVKLVSLARGAAPEAKLRIEPAS